MSRVDKGGRSFRPIAKPNNSLIRKQSSTITTTITQNDQSNQNQNPKDQNQIVKDPNQSSSQQGSIPSSTSISITHSIPPPESNHSLVNSSSPANHTLTPVSVPKPQTSQNGPLESTATARSITSNQNAPQSSSQNPSSSSHTPSAAEKMKLKAQAAKAARAAERLRNPNSSRRATSVLSSISLNSTQGKTTGSIDQPIAQTSTAITNTQSSIVEDIPVPDLSTRSNQTSLPANGQQAWSPPIDPLLEIATFVDQTTPHENSNKSDIPVSNQCPHQSVPDPSPTQSSTSTSLLSHQPVAPKKQSPIARKNKKKASKPLANEDASSDSDDEDISPRLKRQRHLDKLRKNKKRRAAGNVETQDPSEASENQQNKSRKKNRLSEKSDSTSQAGKKSGKKTKKRKQTETNPDAEPEKPKDGTDSDSASDSPLDPTKVSMAELTDPSRCKGQTSEVIEKRVQLIIERRDREKQERMAVREEKKRQARQVLIDRARSIKARKSSMTAEPETVPEQNEQHEEDDQAEDESQALNVESAPVELTNDNQSVEKDTRKKLLDQYGLEDLDSDDDMDNFEEVVFDEFANTKKPCTTKGPTAGTSQSTVNPTSTQIEQSELVGRAKEGSTSEDEQEMELDIDEYIPQASQYAPQLRVVEGQIVLDQDSLEVNRRDQSPELEEMEVVEESDTSRLVNSHTWSKAVRGERWTPDETSLFYDAVRLFGSDFEMIAQLFPGRTRRQIRTKWNREEKTSPQEITDALMGKRRLESSTTTNTPLASISEEEAEEEEEALTEDVDRLVIPSHLSGFSEYARIVGIDCSGPIPEDPMDKWREKERLELEEADKLSRKNQNPHADDTDLVDGDDEEAVVEETFSGWGEIDD